MKKLIVSLLCSLVGFSMSLSAAVWNSDGSPTSIQYIHDNQASNGDTIRLPTITTTWNSSVTITKSIILKGVNKTATIINRGAGFTGAFVTIAPTSDLFERVSGIRFNSSIGQTGDLYSIYISGPYGGTWGLTQIRIDNCYFQGGQRVIFPHYRVNGVVDHNTFYDCAYITEHFGDDDFAWTRASTPSFGTSDSIFFENNLIIADDNISYFDTLADLNTGGKYVWRFNTFDTTAYTGVFGSLIGEHGNQAYWAGSNDWLRGGIMCEFYNNTVKFGDAFRIIWFRGGRNIVANNKFLGTIGSGAIVAFDEEEEFGGSGISPARVAPNQWPAEDQINNTFIFNNKVNGVAMPASMVYVWQSGSENGIQLSRDYWLQAPSSITQTTYPQPGYPSLSTYPLPYNPPVTSWTPYTYPHPLTLL